jgi:predicted HTH transcriptional regulator
LIQKAFSQITKEDIQSLVRAMVREGRTLEYDQRLTGDDTDSKAVFLYNVSSFTNTAGGDIVFGIADERDVRGATEAARLKRKKIHREEKENHT